MKFSIGDLVVEKKELRPHTSYNIHKVVAFLDGDLLATHYGYAFDGEVNPESGFNSEPGSRGWRTNIIRLEEKELCTPEEALIELHSLEAAKSKLEAEFESIRDQVKTNLDQATLFVKKAFEVIKPLNKEFRDLTQECSDLFIALDDGGWAHSTLSCKHGR